MSTIGRPEPPAPPAPAAPEALEAPTAAVDATASAAPAAALVAAPASASPETPAAAAQGGVLVACLCAAWCHTCNAYQATLAGVAAARPDLRFAWIDIEDDADTLGDDSLDIETFPTVMVLRDGQVLFHGTLLPHGATLLRLLASVAGVTHEGGADSGPSPAAPAVPAAFAHAVWQLGPLRPLPGTSVA